MLLNIVYVHLRGRCRHVEKCTQQRCSGGCGFQEFDAWLESPVLRCDALADDRRQQRLAALVRGEISA